MSLEWDSFGGRLGGPAPLAHRRPLMGEKADQAGGKSLRQRHFYRQKKYRQVHKFIILLQILSQLYIPPLAEAGLTVSREWSIGRNEIPSAIPSG